MSKIEIPDSVKVWKIGTGSGNIRSMNSYKNNEGYSLFCKTNGKYLTYVKTPPGMGISLGFKQAAENKTHFRVRDGKEREILSGELVAFGIGAGDPFLTYAERPTGVGLKWSPPEAPQFEWKIISNTGELGVPIKKNSLVALINIRVRPAPDFFIYFDRLAKMCDVGWTTTKQNIVDKAIRLADDNKLKIAKAAIAAL